MVSATVPHGRESLFSGPKPLLFIQVAPPLTSRGWVDLVPDPLLLRKSGSAGNRTRDLCICSQKLWPLDHRGGVTLYNPVNKTNLVHNLFLVYLSISTCFGRLCAHHQEKQLCFCDTWYLLLVVYDSLECWVEFHPATAYFWAITQRELVFPYTDVSGQPIGPIFKLQEEWLLTLEDETDKLSPNVGINNYHYSFPNSLEGRCSLRLLWFNTFSLLLPLSLATLLNISGRRKYSYLNRLSHVSFIFTVPCIVTLY